MDQEKIGRFIAQLRREQGMTQEALGQELLVTNKTVSRWETGAYLPDLETLLLLSRLFQVSLEELLAGERLDRRPPAPTPVPLPSDRFSKKEREAFYTAKWRRDPPLLAVPGGLRSGFAPLPAVYMEGNGAGLDGPCCRHAAICFSSEPQDGLCGG